MTGTDRVLKHKSELEEAATESKETNGPQEEEQKVEDQVYLFGGVEQYMTGAAATDQEFTGMGNFDAML